MKISLFLKWVVFTEGERRDSIRARQHSEEANPVNPITHGAILVPPRSVSGLGFRALKL